MISDKGKSGLQHKIDDFLDASEIAMKTDRALVDFSPAMRADYMRNKNMETVIPNATYHMRYYHGWSYTKILDTTQIQFELMFRNVSQQSKNLLKCVGDLFCFAPYCCILYYKCFSVKFGLELT